MIDQELLSRINEGSISRASWWFFAATGEALSINTEVGEIISQNLGSEEMAFLGIDVTPDVKYFYIDPFQVETTAIIKCYNELNKEFDPRFIYYKAITRSKGLIKGINAFISFYIFEHNEFDYDEHNNPYDYSFSVKHDTLCDIRSEIAALCEKNLKFKVKHWLGENRRQNCFYIEGGMLETFADKLADFYYIATKVVISYNQIINFSCKPSELHQASEAKIFFDLESPEVRDMAFLSLSRNYYSMRAITHPYLECYNNDLIQSKQKIGRQIIGISIAPKASSHLALASIIASFIDESVDSTILGHLHQSLEESLIMLEDENTVEFLLKNSIFTYDFLKFFVQQKRAEIDRL